MTAQDPEGETMDAGSNDDRPHALGRREFLKASALGVGGVALAGSACTDAPPGTAGGDAWWVGTSFELEEMTIADLGSAMTQGRLSSVEVTRAYLERIAALDRAGPGLQSIIETNPEALEVAERLDAERAAGTLRGPLHGVPIVLKDNIDTADRMTTTAGSLALEGHVAAADAHVAAKLREAGAILLAKANLSEWANFRSTRSSSGWSGRGGQCGNAFAIDRNPCGSSSGSAAATSANFCAASIGTETNGSIICPSSVNGVVGLKPTVGLVSRGGIIPIAHTQDTAGPITRTVADAAHILSALVGADARDPMSAPAAGFAGTDYTTFLDPNGLRGVRIGVERSYFGADPQVDALMEDAIRAMAAAGAVIVDDTLLTTRAQLGLPSGRVLRYEFKADIAAYLEASGRPNGMATLEDLIAFNAANATREMPWFGQEIFEECARLGGLESPEYLQARETARRLSRDEGIDALMEAHQLDAIVAPATRQAWKTDLLNGTIGSAGSSGPAAIAGYPSITVPNGYVNGLPVGILFFGRAWSEGTLIRVAYAYQQAAPHRRAARMAPTLDPPVA